MSVLNQSGEEQVECPLCLESLEVDDLNFFPCTCGYQICRFCWHRIRTDENGLCPACRKAYSENPADFKPLSQEEMSRLKAEKRHKDQQRKQKITDNRKYLANIRVVQRNLVFVVGLPVRLADAEVLKKHEYFGKFGKILKVVINQSTSYAGSQGPSASAYVTYLKADDALRAIQAVNNISVDGRTIKTSLGTTKYCSHFMKNQSCPKSDCMYLHELGDGEASFTKEEMQQGKHQEYEKKLHEQLLNLVRRPTPPPAVASCQNAYQGSSSTHQSCVETNHSCSKEAWPSLQPGAASNSSNGSAEMGNMSNNSNNSTARRQTTKGVSGSNKKRHTSGDKSEGQGREKFESSQQDEVISKGGHSQTSVATSSSEITNELGVDVQEQLCSRLMPVNHRSTLFEPDNNSFFSTNNFTKVATTTPGATTADWPVNGLSLTHMPDVLPSVHSSEDWQAAFGFTNSITNPPNSQHQENNCTIMPCEENQRNEQESLGLATVFSPSTSNLSDKFRLHVSNSEHLTQKSVCGNSIISKEVTSFHNSLNPPITSTSSIVLHKIFPHSSLIDKDPSVVMMQHQQYHTSNLMNGLPPCQATDFHLLKQVHVCDHSSFVENGGKLNLINGTDFIKGGMECKVSSDSDCISDFICHQQKNLGLEYKTRNSEEVCTKDNGRLTDDELGFDPFHETQKALAEMMEKENMMSMMQNKQPPSHLSQHLYQQMNHLNHTSSKLLSSYYGLPQQNHRLPPNVSGCTKLLDGLGLGPSGQTRTRLPPPGFTTAPNHMNAFGLGIPRAPSNNSSKILPFMGVGNGCGSSINGASSPIPHHSNSMVHPQDTTRPVLFNSSSNHSHSFALQNGNVPKSDGEDFSMEWSLLPPSPASTMQKGWAGSEPCVDWTALDPAIVSSSCQSNFLVATSANPNVHVVQQNKPGHWIRSLSSDNSGCIFYGSNMDTDWTVSHNDLALPPPGFSSMQQQETVSAKKQSPTFNTELGKPKISEINETGEGMLQSNEEDRMEGLR